jgi:hypothetical protein
MDTAQVLIFYAGWIFFTAWGMVLAAVSAIAFGRDIVRATPPTNAKNERPSANGLKP